MSLYKKEFVQALVLTESLGFTLPATQLGETRLLSKEIVTGLGSLLGRYLPNLINSIEELSGNCISINYHIQNVIEEYLKCPLFLTLGTFSVDNEPIYPVTEEFLRGYLKDGIKGPQIRAHAWLTLPSLEVIDITLFTTLDVCKFKTGDGLGRLLASHPDELKEGLKLHPMIIGAEYLKKIGAIKPRIKF